VNKDQVSQAAGPPDLWDREILAHGGILHSKEIIARRAALVAGRTGLEFAG
jgi:hypothetical protein